MVLWSSTKASRHRSSKYTAYYTAWIPALQHFLIVRLGQHDLPCMEGVLDPDDPCRLVVLQPVGCPQAGLDRFLVGGYHRRHHPGAEHSAGEAVGIDDVQIQLIKYPFRDDIG